MNYLDPPRLRLSSLVLMYYLDESCDIFKFYEKNAAPMSRIRKDTIEYNTIQNTNHIKQTL